MKTTLKNQLISKRLCRTIMGTVLLMASLASLAQQSAEEVGIVLTNYPRPADAIYVSLSGNDLTGTGAETNPYQTL